MLEPSDTLMPDIRAVEDTIARTVTNSGRSLLDLSHDKPTLVVFLRHSGCPFCLEALHDIQRQRRVIEDAGTQIVLVHMGPEEADFKMFEAHGVQDLPRIADPDQSLYRSFGLRRGSLWQLGGPKVWLRVFRAVAVGKRVVKASGDAWQMPGVFLLHRGEVIAAYRHTSQADRPDYTRLACALPRSSR